MAATLPPGFSSRFEVLEAALKARREGRTYQQIAAIIGLKDEKTAQKIVSTAIKGILKETAEEVRSIELSRLELLIKTLWESAILDAQASRPDFRRLDRVKGLIEAKLKWCGATPVIEGGDNIGNVTITINRFTNVDAHVQQSAVPQTAEQIEHELATILPTEGKEEYL